jgi:Glycosyl transferase family 11
MKLGRATPHDALRAVSLRGRIGNQMFQYGMLRRLVGPDRPLPVDTLSAGPEDLMRLLVPGRVRRLTLGETVALHLRCRPDGCIRRWLSSRCAREMTPGLYDAALLAAEAPCLFQGYFQHERYVADIDLLGELRPPSDRAQNRIDELRAWRAGDSLVAVLVRAGADYARMGWGQGLEWFVDASRKIAGTVDRPAFVVFSDVPLAARAIAEVLGPLGPAAAAGDTLTPADQLHVAARCDHAVLSSSSFAWWAGFFGDQLNKCTERIVVAPEPWLFAGDETARAQWRTLPNDRGPVDPIDDPFV